MAKLAAKESEKVTKEALKEMREICQVAKRHTRESIRTAREAVTVSMRAFEEAADKNEETSKAAQKAVRASMRVFENALKSAEKMGALNIEPTAEKHQASGDLEEREASMAFEKALGRIREEPAVRGEAVKNTSNLPAGISLDGLIQKTKTHETEKKEAKKDTKDIKSRLSFLSNMYSTDKSKQGEEDVEEPMENE